MKIDIRFDENMNDPKYYVTEKISNKKLEIFEIRTEDTKQLDFVIISYSYSIENAVFKNLCETNSLFNHLIGNRKRKEKHQLLIKIKSRQ